MEKRNTAKITKARTLRKNSTDAERLLWKHLRMRQLGAYKFRRQQPIGAFIVDFVCQKAKLIIELDGGQHTGQVEYDEKRSAWLQDHGYRILRFWNHDVLKMPDVVMSKILEQIEAERIPPHLGPLPRWGEDEKQGGATATATATAANTGQTE